MKLITRNPFIFISVVAAATFIVAMFTITAFANPTVLVPKASTAVATTTVALMTAGTATTTLVYDTYGVSGTNQSFIGDTAAADSAVLLVQLTASSTLTTLNTNIEFSQDGVDWYQNSFNSVSSTTASSNISTTASFTWTFASSTPGLGAIPGNNNRNSKAISIPTPTRFVRAVFTLPIGSANAAVYAEIVPKKQRAER